MVFADRRPDKWTSSRRLASDYWPLPNPVRPVRHHRALPSQAGAVDQVEDRPYRLAVVQRGQRQVLGAGLAEADGGLCFVALPANLDDDAFTERRMLDIVAGS